MIAVDEMNSIITKKMNKLKKKYEKKMNQLHEEMEEIREVI